MEKLTDEMLENVTGGKVYHLEMPGPLRYCKYCNANRPYTQVPDRTGYEGEFAYQCRVYRCKICYKDTYWCDTNFYLD